jgi:two-component system chemotaxis response regulator CheY
LARIGRRKQITMANIMIVDDSTMMRNNLKFMIQKAGHTVVAEASNGKSAMLAYRRHKPDIVTLDISMPDIDGVTVVKNIIKEFPDAKIIMISALSQKGIVYEAIVNGAKGYIVKPVEYEKVAETIKIVEEG